MYITMAASIASRFPNMDKNEIVYAEFIKGKIEKSGGQIKFQHITGHLSQLNPDVRQVVGTSPSDLRNFLQRHNKLFSVDSGGIVSLQKIAASTTEDITKRDNTKKDKMENDCYNTGSESAFPNTISEASGIVIKVLPAYGFIAIKKPVKTSVYFTAACVIDKNLPRDDENGRLLTDIPGMLPGKKVLLNAKKGNTNVEAKYRATKVWTPPKVENEVLVPKGFQPKDSLYEPVALEGSGTIQKVFDQFGFITNTSSSGNIFFHKSRVCNVQNIMSLSKVFQEGDLVEFKAVRSSKKDIKAKWEATKVWMKKTGKTNLFKGDNSSGVDMESNSKSNKGPQLLKEEPGKIYPSSDGVVIKFGKNDCELADADSCLFYLYDTKVTDIRWEFSNGDNVHFDAVKIKSAPGWKAILAWMGDRPKIVLKPHLGDFTELSENEYESESFVPDLKSKVVRPSEYSREYNHDKPSINSTNRTRTFVPSSAPSEVSNTSSRSKSHTSADKDFDLSDGYTSSVSGKKEMEPERRYIRRNRRPKRNNSSKILKKVSSSSNLADDVAMESEDSYSNHSLEFRNSAFSEEYSNTPSPSSLKPSASSESLDLRARLKPNPNLFKSWGDTPYPEEEDDETLPASEKNASQESYVEVPIEETKQKSLLSDDEIENELPHSKPRNWELLPSEDESIELNPPNATIETDVKLQKSSDFDCENRNQLLNETQSDNIASNKSDSYVKFFRDLEGKILKVFCKYAEIENSSLKRSVSVLWNDLYHNGVPVSDKFDSMKEIISPGQIIKFNCIEIMDDDGAFWQKVTLAWKGQRPKVEEITPREYISQNYLPVSIDEDSIEYNYKDSKIINTVLKPEPESLPAPPRKFLSVVASSEDEESHTPSVKSDNEEEESSVPAVNSTNECESNMDLTFAHEQIDSILNEDDELANTVGSLISQFSNSKTDIKRLSLNIISLVRRRTSTTNTVQLPSMSTDAPKTAVKNAENQTDLVDTSNLPKTTGEEMKDSDAQTIITGDVIAQSIFTL